MADLEIKEHKRYAVDQKAVEQFYEDYQIQDIYESRVIPIHTKIIDFVPKPEAMISLFNLNHKKVWAYFRPPENYLSQRLYFFNAFQGTEMDELEDQRVQQVDCSHQDIEEEKQRMDEKDKILQLCHTRISLRKDYEYIISRIHEFVQG